MRYVLFVGGIEPRKNLERLVKAFAESDAQDLTLVIAGGPGSVVPGGDRATGRGHRALPPSVKERIVRTGYVNDRDKLALLSGATVLAYPSLYEGFGFPVLEAFAAGVPVMTSNVSSLPEVAGEAAVLVDPADVHAIAKALSELVERRGPPGGAVRCGGRTSVPIHLGGNGSRDRRRVARGRRGDAAVRAPDQAPQ